MKPTAEKSVLRSAIRHFDRSLTSNLVSESLRLDDRDVINDTLVGVEIASESIKIHIY